MRQSFIFGTIRAWLPFALLVSACAGLIYVAVQQDLRQGADDPQIQIAEDAARAIEAGASADTIVPKQTVDAGVSLAPWVAVYDASGTLVASSGKLDGAALPIPQGFFNERTWEANKIHPSPAGDETRVTWEPETGVRHAVVIIHMIVGPKGGYVVAGRSLRDVETREDMLTLETELWWAGITFAMLVLIGCIRFFRKT